MRSWIAFCSASAAAAAFAVAARLVPGREPLLLDLSVTLATATGAVAATVGWRRAPLTQRRTWQLIALGVWASLLGQLAWDLDGSAAAFPSAADLFWLLSPALGIWGLLRLAPVNGLLLRVRELDGVAVLAGIGALAAAWLYMPVANSSLGVAAKAAALAYPLLYGALIVTWIDVLAATPDLRRHRGPIVALCGVAANAAGWILYAYDTLDGHYAVGYAFGLLWIAGQLALGAGALLAEHDGEVEAADTLARLRRRTVLPTAGFVALIGTLMAFGALDRPFASRLVLEAGMLILGGVLVVRNRLTTGEAQRVGRRSTQLLEQRNSELEVFAQAASHDLKAPLVSIQGLSGALARSNGELLDAKGRLYIERIQANAAAMQALIDSLLEFARVGVDEVSEPIDADAIVRAAVAEARSRANGTVIELLTPIPPLCAHPVRFRQALANLIENAERYGDSAVRVSARALDDTVEILVDDDGPGVPAKERERVFELFSRGRVGLDRAPTGSGFGLALVRKIAASSGGSVRCEDAPTAGARFVLAFPKGAK